MMQTATLKTIARHLAAVQSGTIEKTNVIGIRKAINAMERNRTNPAELIDALFELTEAIGKHRPTVAGELHESGLKVLRNPRYAKRWTPMQDCTIRSLDYFQLIRFDWIGPRGDHVVPVYRAVATDGASFAFRNIPWQSAWSLGEKDGPRVVPEREQ